MKQDNWKVWHDTAWTEFETHSAIFGILRKELRGKYIVRGEYVFFTSEGEQMRPDISIFQITEKGKPAELKLILEIAREGSLQNKSGQLEKYKRLQVPVLLLTGKEGLQNLPEIIKEHL